MSEGGVDAASETADKSVHGRTAFAADLGGVALLGSAAAYALGYAAQDSFFGAFGLTPDQVGIDKLAALLRIVPLATIFGFCLAVLFTIGIGLGTLIHQRLPDRIRARWPVPVYVPALAVLLITILTLSDSLPSDPVISAGVNVTICWLATAVVWAVFRAVWNARTASAAAAVATVILGTFLLYTSIPDGAKTLRASGEVRARLDVVGIRSGYVDVRWHDPRRRPPELAANPPGGRAIAPPPYTVLPRLLVVLNQSGGTYTLWDCAGSRIYTVRDADADVVRILPPRVTGSAVGTWTGCTG